MKTWGDYKKQGKTDKQSGKAFQETERLLSVLVSDSTHQSDTERISLFYILCGNDDLYSKINHIYDFKEKSIRLDCLESEDIDFSSSSRSLVKIGFNLYNGYPADISETLSTLDEDNFTLAVEAIKIRFNME